MTPILRAESIGKRFGERQVLKAATLYANPGTVTAIVGRNGCGKSTLLQTIAGVQSFDFGVVHFRSRIHTRPRLHVLARDGLFYVPERGLLSPMFTVNQHLDLTRASSAARQECVRTLDLDPLIDRFPRQLSTGERRRAEFALAILRSPLCLLADEPFQGIAPLDLERMFVCIRQLAARGAAIVITGHETTAWFDIADRVVWLTAGTTLDLGSVTSARRHAQFRREYLGWDDTGAASAS